MRQMFSKGQLETLINSNQRKLYRHYIAIKNTNCSLGLIFINDKGEELNKDSLLEEINKYNIVSPISGIIKNGEVYLISSYGVEYKLQCLLYPYH